MSRFTVRVELHAASEADYQRLHTAMAAQRFSRIITADDGSRHHLPTAEYDHQSTETVSQVCDRTYGIASGVRHNPAVLVTEGGWSARGLVRAT
ncbi:endoribonuclease GhoS [Pseudolysobacter antarcticus]|uniref:Endoribonuclease GhoS n=1 Tax=Pseudolysobacter antarcticus TaxID=2511995 RepID=A0A411HFS7_9GAMM|nr:type V toxin-antitoxin system endoribonuclease antitoxin GhoS [Pseudolysobacter antarcticus]QBB69345.1 endoribonuclease GhoS [Pseudolysobacter antarcticus]